MSFLGRKPNVAVILSILPGTDGVVKMSKSLGNHIPINTDAEDMYGKVMSVPDAAMGQFARLVTRWLPEEVAVFEKDVQSGSLHPRDAKMKLAKEIVASFYGEEDAGRAQEAFVRLFQQRQVPEEMPDFRIQLGQTVLDVMMAAELVASKSEGRRLIAQRGVKLDGVVLEDASQALSQGGVLQVGKRHFVRLIV